MLGRCRSVNAKKVSCAFRQKEQVSLIMMGSELGQDESIRLCFFSCVEKGLLRGAVGRSSMIVGTGRVTSLSKAA